MNPAEMLAGMTLDNEWEVKNIINRHPKGSGGHFSVGYLVENLKTKQKAYLKALDFTAAFQSPDPPRELQIMTQTYNYERDLLIKCKGLKRIIKPLFDGNVLPKNATNDFERVYYIGFELADSDIRTHQLTNAFDLAWCLRSLHHSAVAIEELHDSGIAHQDLKPSNVLFFKEEGSKLGDFGRSKDMLKTAPHDRSPVPGDRNYAPFELYYSNTGQTDGNKRFMADLYLLGSLIFFHFSNLSATQAIKMRLKAQLSYGTPQENFLGDLPYLIEAFKQSISDLELAVKSMANDLTQDIVEVAKILCDPDPSRRGDKQIIGVIPKHNLERIISKFDFLANKAEAFFK